METQSTVGGGFDDGGSTLGGQAAEGAQRVATEADRIWRQNPVPVVIGALAAGLLIGMAVRAAEPRSRSHKLADALDDSEDYLRDALLLLKKAAKKGYKHSASAVSDGLGKASHVAHDVEDDYVDPAVKWFRKFWKKCCS